MATRMHVNYLCQHQVFFRDPRRGGASDRIQSNNHYTTQQLEVAGTPQHGDAALTNTVGWK